MRRVQVPTPTHDLESGATESLPPASAPLPSQRPASRFAPGMTLAGRYRIVAPLGRGGMGEVYRAEDLRLGETVALKFLAPEVLADRTAIERMAAEVRVSRQVTHPAVCRVHDLVEADGHAFLSMEYVDGEDLSSLIQRIGALPAGKALELGRDICAGLAAVHARGIVHRDLKPANVMVDSRGRARLTDFGVAAPAALAGSRELAGTPAYMAPEQLAGGGASVRSDLYALGLVFFEMLCGRRAFAASTVGELRDRQRAGPPAFTGVVGTLPPALTAVLASCLDPAPDRRPRAAGDVLAQLPGGDHLAAAMAAGATPEPADVAAAAEVGLLRPAVAWSWLVVALAGLLGLASLADRTKLHRLVGLPKPPVVLADRAHEILAAARYDVPVVDRATGFFYAANTIGRAGSETDVPPPLRFFLRVRPRRLDPWHAQFDDLLLATSSDLGVVALRDPPFEVPGEARVVLDPAGRLIELAWLPLAAVRPRPDVGPAPGRPWSELLAATGVSDLAAATPATSPLPADAWWAWTGSLSNARVRIDGAALGGQPSWLRVTAEPPPPAANSALGSFKATSDIFIALLGVGMFLVGGSVLVWRNLRLGRGDRAGAERLAAVVFVSQTLAVLLRVHHQADVPRELLLLGTLLSQTSFAALLAWGSYMAIEPAVRRRWPQTLVSWARLVAGRPGDPMVGRDTLVGVVAGLALAALLPLSRWLEALLGSAPLAPPIVIASAFNDLSHALHPLLYLPYPALLHALGFLLFLVLLRSLLRRTWLAVTALWLTATLPFVVVSGGRLVSVTGALAALSAAVLVATLLRCGLLATAVAIAVYLIGGFAPLTLDTGAWYFGQSLLTLLLLGGVAVAAFLAALGGRGKLVGSWLD